MDISSLIGTLMSSDSLQNIGSAVETDDKSVQSVLAAALPSLINGAKEQSADETTGFAEALLSHGKKDTSDLSSFLGNIDLEDGGKIIAHLLGKDKDSKIGEIAEASGVSKKNTSGILAAAAPLLMSLLGQTAASNASDTTPSAISSVASLLLKDADIGSLLGGILGAVNTNTEAAPAEDTASTNPGGLFGFLAKLFK